MASRTKLVDLEWLESNFPCMQACPVHTQAGRHTVEIAGASHAVYASRPKEVAALIEEAALRAR